MQATEQLAQGGRDALDEFLNGEREFESNIHPRDLADVRWNILAGFAAVKPDLLIEKMVAGEGDYSAFLGALRWAKDDASIDVLVAALKHRDPLIRDLAATALIERRADRAVPALVQLLKDRSSTIKSTIVYAPACYRIFRLPEAVPLLRRISESTQALKHDPMTVKRALRVIELIGEEA